GEGLWEHSQDQSGVVLYRAALHVPLRITLPHSARRGSVIERPVPLVDLFPTILQLVGIEKSARSLLADASPKAIYSETLYPRIHIGWSELRSLIDERFHYIDGPRPELYYLRRDPGDVRDLVATARGTEATRPQHWQALP